MKIEETKVQEVLQMSQAMLDQGTITLHQLEVLIGKLTYASKLAEPARKFMNRLLHFRRIIPEKGSHGLPLGSQDDLKWFLKFLTVYNCTQLSSEAD